MESSGHIHQTVTTQLSLVIIISPLPKRFVLAPPPLATNPDLSKKIWSASIPPKFKHFIWKMGSGILAVKDNLIHRHIPVDPTCPRCCHDTESSLHASFLCPFAQQVWRLSGLPISITDENVSLHQKLDTIFSYASRSDLSDEHKLLPFWVIWRLWKSRNDLLFNRTTHTAVEVITKAREDLKEWLDCTHTPRIIISNRGTRFCNRDH